MCQVWLPILGTMNTGEMVSPGPAQFMGTPAGGRRGTVPQLLSVPFLRSASVRGCRVSWVKDAGAWFDIVRSWMLGTNREGAASLPDVQSAGCTWPVLLHVPLTYSHNPCSTRSEMEIRNLTQCLTARVLDTCCCVTNFPQTIGVHCPGSLKLESEPAGWSGSGI